MKIILAAIISLGVVQAFGASISQSALDNNKISYKDYDVVHEYLGEVEFDEIVNYGSSTLATELCPSNNSRLQATTPSASLIDPTTVVGVVEIVNGVEILLDKIEKVGTKFFNLISKGSIDPCYKDKVLHVLPQGVEEASLFSTVTGWNKPKAKGYSLTLMSRNISGRKVVKFDYQVVATYGGSVNGKGKYLANVHVLPIKEPSVSFRWGFDVKVKSLTPVNLSSDKQNPVAGIEISVDYIAKPILFGATRIGSAGFFIDGEGNIDKICAVNAKRTLDSECISDQVEN